ncbi:MAG TPA: alpha/beta fold hydrolase [Candidatus Dormibacteraeota bacterium]|nr:alpha/beta fold hydrolase [Candidatus Dormibacteraeota bacterium]
MTDSFITAPDGAALAVTVEGEGQPLLLIPGLGATRVVFRPLMPLLTSHFRVAVYDQRGIGESGVTPGPFSTAQLADDAAAVLDGARMDRATVLGASFGGMVAQEVAVGHPARLDALVLAASGPGSAHLVEEPDPAAATALLGRGARSPEEAYRIACTVLYSRSFQEAHPEFIEQQIRDRATRPIDGRAFRAQLDASRAHDAWDRLPSVTAPTLVMHGSEDAVMPLANARALAERIPGARLVVFDGAGHLFFHEEPERTAAVLVEFAAEVSSRSV